MAQATYRKEKEMSKRNYDQLTKEYRKKDHLYPDRGRSSRPWEQPLRQQLQAELNTAAAAGEDWAIKLKKRGERWI